MAGVGAVLVGVASRGAHAEHRREIALLVGSGLAMLLGSAATSDFTLRYLLPSVPLLASGGAIAARELVLALQARATVGVTGRGEGGLPAARGGMTS
jgi:hypothetical protein